MKRPSPIPPRIVIEVACARLREGYWIAQSPALPGRTGGETVHDAAENLRRLAEGIAGEPVKALVTVFSEDVSARAARAAGKDGK